MTAIAREVQGHVSEAFVTKRTGTIVATVALDTSNIRSEREAQALVAAASRTLHAKAHTVLREILDDGREYHVRQGSPRVTGGKTDWPIQSCSLEILMLLVDPGAATEGDVVYEAAFDVRQDTIVRRGIGKEMIRFERFTIAFEGASIPCWMRTK